MPARAKLTRQDLESLRVAYQASIELSTSNAQVVWGIFNAMLLANTIVVGAVTLTLTSEPRSPILASSLALFGLLSSAFWFFLVKRARRYADYFILAARELEELHFSPHVSLLSRGGRLAHGGTVEVAIGGQKRTVTMDFWSRRGRVETASNVLIPAFFLLDLVLLFLALRQFGA